MSNEDKENKSAGSEILSWVKTIVFAILIALAINNFVIVNATVPTGSMENTIMPHDRIVALRLTYYFSSPKRGDIVVFKYPDDESTLYVKRVIGLPGETVEVKDGKVYINGSDTPLDDSFIKEKAVGDFGPYQVPEDCYFMMGDNRNNSLDSRFWVNKFVKRDKILGKVYFKYFKGFEILK
ncbi:MAG: signal peptidase I [Clostridia bacterium]|jgi:signal peptidase I|nr:signal peptidase I [Clostridia bacterium]